MSGLAVVSAEETLFEAKGIFLKVGVRQGGDHGAWEREHTAELGLR